MGKRPLCMFSCICLMAVVFWFFAVRPPAEAEGCEGPVTAVGELYYREQEASRTILYLKDVHISENPKRILLDRLIVYLTSKETYPIGMVVKVKGKLYPAKSARNPGQFDEAWYLRSRGISHKLQGASVNAVWTAGEASHGFMERLLMRLREGLVCQKEELLRRLDVLFSETEASVLKAMLFGAAKEVPKELKSSWQSAGIGHLLAISGLHVMLLCGTLYRGFRNIGLPYGICIPASAALLICYQEMLGFRVSAFRAAGMFLVFLGAELTGKAYDRLSALALLCLAVVAKYPYSVGTSGFWLSFSASAGAAAFLEWAQERERVRKEAGFRERRKTPGMLLPLWISAASLPVQLWFFYELPVYSLLWNLCLVPLAAPVLGFALLALAFSLWSFPAGMFVGAPAQLLLELIERICVLAEKLPGAVYICGRPLWWQMALYYAALLGCMWVFWPGRERKGKGRILLLAGAAAALGCLVFLRVHAPLEVTFLDVGQGDGALIREKGGKTLLIDCGSTDEKDVGTDCLIPFLKCCGISRVDYIFISHGDEDHISGIRTLLEQDDISVGCLVFGSRMGAKSEEWMRKAASKGVLIQHMEPGDRLQLSGFSVRCLGPAEEKNGLESLPSETEEENNQSMVLALEGEGIRFLFTGDMEEEEEKLLLHTVPEKLWKANVLKVAHHGSKTSSSEAFLSAVSPALAVISCGENNRYGHPDADTVLRLCSCTERILVTAECGAVRLFCEAGRIRVKTCR